MHLCLADDVFLVPLADSFVRLLLQLISRLSSWVAKGVVADSKETCMYAAGFLASNASYYSVPSVQSIQCSSRAQIIICSIACKLYELCALPFAYWQQSGCLFWL